MKHALILVASALPLAGGAHAGDTYTGVEYISGRAGFEKKTKGRLTVDEEAVRFSDDKGNAAFSIPTTGIDKAEAGAQREEGSFGRRMALGIFASKTKEYLRIEWHDKNETEAVVFKVKKNAGAGMAAKVNFWAGRFKGPATELAASQSSDAKPTPPRSRPSLEATPLVRSPLPLLRFGPAGAAVAGGITFSSSGDAQP
jgi:opacity protein-like surface antigen